MDKKSLAIIGLTICLVIAVGYMVYSIWFVNFITSCRQEGSNNALSSMVQIINSTKQPIDIKIGNEELICSTKTLIGK